jgi:hypothetical protein
LNVKESTMATQTTTRRIPDPLYAAAGAGDLAYQQLRKLPERVAELRERVGELRPAVSDAVSEARRVDLERLREAARRNAAAFVSGVEAAQERASAVYSDLVKRGHRVVRNAQSTQARVEIAPAKSKVTAEIKSEPAAKPAAKRTRPAATTK